MPLRMIRIDQKSVGHGIHVRWSSIFSGAFATLGFGAFFLLLGNALGLSIFNAINPAVGGALRFWSWIYMAATMVFAYYLGGLLATRSNEITSYAAGGLHGIISWGLATSLGAAITALVSPTFRMILTGIGPNSGNWLSTCILGLGLGASTMGGVSGKEAGRYTRVVEEEEEREASRVQTTQAA